MKKLIIFTLMLSSFSVLAQSQMKQKRVCNTLANGAEFCTTFNVPVGPEMKTEEEINAELESQTELRFNNPNGSMEIPSREVKPVVVTQDLLSMPPQSSRKEMESKISKPEIKTKEKPKEIVQAIPSQPKQVVKQVQPIIKKEVKEVELKKVEDKQAAKDFSAYLNAVKSLDK